MPAPKPLVPTQEELQLLSDPAFLKAIKSEGARLLGERQIELYRPYEKQAVFHAQGATHRERLLMAGNQLGKELRADEPVLTPTGWVPIGSLKVGDPVIAGDGTVTTVTGVFPQGVKPMVELTFDYGQKVVAGYDHLWKVLPPRHRWRTRCETLRGRDANGRRKSRQVPNEMFGEWEVWRTRDIISRHGMNPTPIQRFATPHVGTVQFPRRAVPVDPYVLGALLGDGCFRGCIGLTANDNEIADAFHEQVAAFGGRVLRSRARPLDYRATFAPGLRAAIESMGLLGAMSYEKHIPEMYLWNDAETRLAVLQGLMDTDGTCEKTGQVTFTSTSRRLAEDVLFLVRSFGGKGYIKTRVTSYTHLGERRKGRPSHVVTVRLPHVPPFRLQRKLDRLLRPTSTSDHNIIESFREVEPAEAVCISVAHPDRTYVTRGFVVTHNTYSAAAEVAYHLTGEYPEWWQGRRWKKAVAGWAAGVTSEVTRDTCQRLLMGRPGQIGTGMIPKRHILETSAARGIADALDTVVVQHVNGGKSTLTFKSYEKGREKFQGETLDFVWFDEEPPYEIYMEGLTRTNATGGLAFITFTPLQGMSQVVRLFYPRPETGDRSITQMTIDDAGHLAPEQRESIIASYPAHEREARTKGIPMLGSGRIFTVPESAITVEAFSIPGAWPKIGGIDMGWEHPTAAVKLAWDRDNDVVYVVNAYRVRQATILQHAAALKGWGESLPWAWPHDALSHDRASGETIAELYRRQGLNMLWERAQFQDGGYGVEAGIAMLLDRMETGRFKVFSHLSDWLEEFRLYHREEGKVVKEYDDLMSATRYATMMLRYAAVAKGKNSGPLRRNIRGIV